MALGEPAEVTLVEFGPGNGTLMCDMLNAFKAVPAFLAGLQVYMIETSPALQSKQKRALETLKMRTGTLLPPVHFAQSLADVPNQGVTFFVGNEYFDALPIEQFAKSPDGAVAERTVSYDPIQDAFFFTQSDTNYTIIEKCPLMEQNAEEISRRLKQHNGCALFVDYGFEESAAETAPHGDTLQAVKNHDKVPVLDDLGLCDISHLVNFTALSAAFAPLKTTITPQGQFLKDFGILMRLERLSAAHPTHAKTLGEGVVRLIAPGMMGELFKVIMVTKAECK
jgi:SAM-dependent MidA family methyltransferase